MGSAGCGAPRGGKGGGGGLNLQPERLEQSGL